MIDNPYNRYESKNYTNQGLFHALDDRLFVRVHFSFSKTKRSIFRVLLRKNPADHEGRRKGNIPVPARYSIQEGIYRAVLENPGSGSNDRGNFFRVFRADVMYRNESFILKIPIDRATFEEKEDRLHVLYHLKIAVYRDNEKIDDVDETRSCCFTEEEVMEKYSIVLKVP
jgi:hypothetical protein